MMPMLEDAPLPNMTDKCVGFVRDMRPLDNGPEDSEVILDADRLVCVLGEGLILH